MFMQNQNESGRSMLEMIGVLGIMGIIVYGAIAGINFGIDMYKINATYREIDELSQSIVDLSSWASNYAHLDKPNISQTICENDAYPCTGNNMKNQWAGTVTVSAHPSDQNNFIIKYTSVPDVSCKKLRDEAWFKHVCVCKSDIICNAASSEIIFYSRGSSECDSTTARYQNCNN